MRINERSHYDLDLDLLKYRANHARKVFLAAEMRLVLHGDLKMAVQSVAVDSTASQRVPEFPKGLLL